MSPHIFSFNKITQSRKHRVAYSIAHEMGRLKQIKLEDLKGGTIELTEKMEAKADAYAIYTLSDESPYLFFQQNYAISQTQKMLHCPIICSAHVRMFPLRRAARLNSQRRWRRKQMRMPYTR